jgi:AGZA family xanthine/uracil permease-like MFS transporter
MEAIDKYFKLTERGSTLMTEVRAGTATFMTLCYILAGLNDLVIADQPVHALT